MLPSNPNCKINTLPNGLDTIIGERGVRLSGGQRQRIGIARALYHDPLILVFDEATSSLDAATEKEFLKSLVQLKKNNKTILSIAHRQESIDYCDILYKIEKSNIVKVK